MATYKEILVDRLHRLDDTIQSNIRASQESHKVCRIREKRFRDKGDLDNLADVLQALGEAAMVRKDCISKAIRYAAKESFNIGRLKYLKVSNERAYDVIDMVNGYMNSTYMSVKRMAESDLNIYLNLVNRAADRCITSGENINFNQGNIKALANAVEDHFYNHYYNAGESYNPGLVQRKTKGILSDVQDTLDNKAVFKQAFDKTIELIDTLTQNQKNMFNK